MTAITDMVSLEKKGAVALLIVDNPPVNALSHGVRKGLVEGMKQIEADDEVKAVALVCKGRTFIAGADITEFGKPFEPPGLHDALDALEGSSRPTIAVVHGTALGGGFETALACHYRVAVPSARFGFPEVKLGLLPGAGGTQRLPRVVGVQKALEMVTSGNPISAKEAHEAGLVDEILDQEDVMAAAAAVGQKAIDDGWEPKKIRDLDDKIAEARSNPGLFDEFRRTIARRTRGFEAPELNIQAVKAAVDLPFEEGIKKEGELFAKLVTGEQSRAQRYYFFAEREAAKVPDVPKETPLRKIEKVGVLGFGTMGGGISMALANAGIPVTVVEASQERLDKGLGVVRKNYERTAKRGRLTMDQVEERIGLMSTATDMEVFADCDMVIEAVFENMDLKKEIFGKLDGICREGAILATNTSALDVNVIAAETERPEDVIGTHFFSPANIMRLLELVRGEKSAKDVIATSMALGKKIGKIPVLVGVCPGFVGNRILFQRQAEAERLILEGATPWQVDKVLYDFGLPMGPFAMSDLAGLDIGWRKETSASRTIREVLCERGRLGQKSGKGYYIYDPETRASSPDPEVEEVIAEFSKKKGIERRSISDDEILQRCLYPMVNEGARILDEGIAIRASDIDVVWVNGYGWPVYRGGPMFWGESVGLDKIAAAYERFKKDLGDHWQISPLLERLANEGKGFAAA